MFRNPLKVVRVLVATLFFTGLTVAFVDFRGFCPPLLGHALAHVQFVPSLISLALGSTFGLAIFSLGLLGALLFGRVYCSTVCPLGVLQDVIARLGRLFRRKKAFLPFAKPFGKIRHLCFWLPVAAALAGWSGLALALFDPYSNFGRVCSSLIRPALAAANNSIVGIGNAAGIQSLFRVRPDWAVAGVLVPAAIFLTLIAILSAFRGRLYCNTICPVGTALGFASRFSAFRIAIDKSACTKCGDCLRSCKAQCIDLRNGSVDSSRCVACFNCIGVCEHHGIRHHLSWKRTAPVHSGKTKAPQSSDSPRRDFLATLGTGVIAASLLAKKADAEPSSAPIELSALARRGEASPAVCPPGARSVTQFLDRCTACHLCISACPTHVLKSAFLEYGPAGLFRPHLEYVSAYCLYECKTCSDVCPDGALSLPDLATKQVTQIAVAEFHQERCVVEVNGTDCAACSEHCPTKAISTVPFRDNLRLPVLNQSLCIGCGACQYACPVKPVKAFLVTGRSVHARAEKLIEKKATAPTPAEDFPF